MNQLNLEQVQTRLTQIVKQFEQFFNTLNNPENIFMSFDPMWGKRAVSFRIQLDEFSIIEFEKLLPKLKKIIEEYRKLRLIEKELTESAAIEEHIRNHTFLKF